MNEDWEKEFDRRFGLTVMLRAPRTNEEKVLSAWASTNLKIKEFIKTTIQSEKKELLKEVDAIVGASEFEDWDEYKISRSYLLTGLAKLNEESQ